MTQRITADFDTLMKQAPATALAAAREAKGYVEDNFPDWAPTAKATLMASIINHAAIDFAGSVLSQQIADSLDGVAENIGAVSQSIEGLTHEFGEFSRARGDTAGAITEALKEIREFIDAKF